MDKLSNADFNGEEFEQQFKAATERGAARLALLPQAKAAKYNKKSKRLILEMKNGTTLLIPVNLIQGLENGDDAALSDFDLMLEGSQIHWRGLDVQFYIKSLLEGVFGTSKWMDNLKEHLSEAGKKAARLVRKQNETPARKTVEKAADREKHKSLEI